MRKIVVGIVFFTLLTLSITHLAEAQHVWKRNTITNQTNETIHIVWSTAYPAFGSVPIAGYRTSGWTDIPAGQHKSYWAYSTHRIYFLILKGGEAIKPKTSTRTYATWINRNAHFNIVTEREIGEINAFDSGTYLSLSQPKVRHLSKISYSDTSFADTEVYDGFLRYANGSSISVTNNWVEASPTTTSELDICISIDPLPDKYSIDGGFIETQFLAGSVSDFWTREDTAYVEKSTDGIVLTVGFNGGDPRSRDLVKKHAPEWSNHCGVRFRFPVSSDKWDIIVGFKSSADDASWSNFGRGSLGNAREGQPSMNLNFAKRYCGGERGVILHEFGHALGLAHEQQSPGTRVDVGAVIIDRLPSIRKKYKAQAQKKGWSSEELAEEVRKHVNNNYGVLSIDSTVTNYSIYTEFDPDSIMLYSGLPLRDGGYTTCNGDLSEIDKKGIGAIYPKPDFSPTSISVSGIRDGQTVNTGTEFNVKASSLNVSVRVSSAAGLIPKQSVKLSAETGKYSHASIKPNIILTGAAGEAATSRIFLQGADEHVTIHVEVPGTKLKNSYKVFVKGATTTYQYNFDFTVRAERHRGGDERDWERRVSVSDPEWGSEHWKWKAVITGYAIDGGRGDFGCVVLDFGCGSAGVHEDQTTYSGNTLTIHGWVEDGEWIYADAHAYGTITYKVIRSDPNWEEISYSIPQEAVVTFAPSASHSTVDVNGDGHVDTADLLLVSNYIGETGSVDPRVDVNGDGSVTIADLVLVAQYLGQSTHSSVPVAVTVPAGLQYSTVAGWIDLARAENDGTAAFREGIAKLQYLLTLLVPEETVLLANYPNPFNPETWIPYHLSEPADVTLTIYTIGGKAVRRLDLGHQAAGYYQDKSRAAYWDGRNAVGEQVASGLYFYTFTAGDFAATRKMLILK